MLQVSRFFGHLKHCKTMFCKLELVADAEAYALPAECGGGNDVEHRTPVKGDLERNSIEDVLQADLCTYAKADSAAVNEEEVGSRASIESERTYGCNLEVIGCCNINCIYSPAGINFEEILSAERVLIGNFTTPSCADTECTGLSACKCHNSEHCNNNCQNLFHKQKVLVGQIY